MYLSCFPQNFLGIIRESFFDYQGNFYDDVLRLHFFGLFLNFMFKFFFIVQIFCSW